MNKSEIEVELSSGETVIWQGRPPAGVRLRGSDVLLIPFSLMWGGFAIFWEISVVTSSNAPFFFKLWGVPFVLVGLYLIGGRFVYDAARRRQTFYAVTNRRVLIVNALLKRKVTSLSLETLPEITTEEGYGMNVISFGSTSGGFPHIQGWPGSAKVIPPQFELAENPRRVFNMIQEAKHKLLLK